MITNSMIQGKKSILLIILIGFIISTLLTVNNLKKYDKYFDSDNGESYHQMIKSDAMRYLSHANFIKDQLKSGMNFFETGRTHYTKYLPPRILAAYYYFFNIDPINESSVKKINLGIHFPFLLLQSIVYFFSVTLLYLSASKIFNPRICFYLILFLSIEPTINQYHASFWSETFLFSFMILLTSLMINPDLKMRHFLLIGLLLGTISLQKEYTIFYIIPIIIYYLFILKDQRFKNITVLLIGFIIVQSILGFNNLKRSGEFYILSTTTKISLQNYLVSDVIMNVQKKNLNEYFLKEGEVALRWINRNSIEYNQDSKKLKVRKGLKEYRASITHERDLIKFDNFITSRTLNYIIQYPLDFTKHILKKSIHFSLLNPFHIYSDNNYRSSKVYYTSLEHDKFIPYRIFYTLVIYFFCLVGFISMMKKKNYKILFFLIISILSFYLPVSWLGNTRNFVPCLIFISFFFAFGAEKVQKLIEVTKNKQ